MRHWFLTTAIVAISSLTLSMTISIVLMYFILKDTLKSILKRIYPESNKLIYPPRKFKNDDIFTNSD